MSQEEQNMIEEMENNEVEKGAKEENQRMDRMFSTH